MTTFYICRHGQTENNKNKRFSGWTDTPLTEEGAQDAISAAQKLHGVAFDRIVASDLGRAFITAYIIVRENGYPNEIERAKGLREINYGDFAGRKYSAYPKLSPQENTNFVLPNGESLAQMQRRVMRYLAECSAGNSGKTILLAAHDGTINAVRATFSGEEIGIADLTHSAHDFVGKFEFEAGKVLAFTELKQSRDTVS